MSVTHRLTCAVLVKEVPAIQNNVMCNSKIGANEDICKICKKEGQFLSAESTLGFGRTHSGSMYQEMMASLPSVVLTRYGQLRRIYGRHEIG